MVSIFVLERFGTVVLSRVHNTYCRLADDILVSKTKNTILMWRWLGFSRFFDLDTGSEPKSMFAQLSDVRDSRELLTRQRLSRPPHG